MVKVVETNVSKSGDFIVDHQSRVVEFLSWREYKKQFIFHGDIPASEPISYTGMPGKSISPGTRITKLMHNNVKLYCEFNTETRDCILMAYLLEEEL